jgi:hypothetical protein
MDDAVTHSPGVRGIDGFDESDRRVNQLKASAINFLSTRRSTPM